jgi:hypothetical protein
MAAGISSPWIPTDTLINMCCGRSATAKAQGNFFFFFAVKILQDLFACLCLCVVVLLF